MAVISKYFEDNSKLLQQLKSGFERTINWNKYQSKVSMKAQNPYFKLFRLIQIFRK